MGWSLPSFLSDKTSQARSMHDAVSEMANACLLALPRRRDKIKKAYNYAH